MSGPGMRRHIIGGIVVALAGVGVWASIDLTREHMRVIEDLVNETEHESWCTVEGTAFDCAAVSRSRWSEHRIPPFRYPVPTSIPPLGFFAAFGTLALLGWWRRGSASYPADRARDDTLAFAWSLLLPAAVVDGLLIYVMKFVLHTWCIVCLGIDVATLLLLLLTPLARTRGWRGLLSSVVPGMLRHGNWAVFVAVFGITVPLAQHVYSRHLDPVIEAGREKQQEDQQRALDEFAAEHASRTPVEGLLRGDEPHRGTPGAPFLVVEFADFQCPYCATAALEIHEIMAYYPDQIDFAFRHYPLSTDCHPYVSRNLHPDACMAAYALECAGRFDKYWEMYDSLFPLFAKANAERARPSLENIREIAHILEIPASEFYYCLEDEAIRQQVVQSVEDGRAAGVTATPAVFVNGVLIDKGGGAPTYLERLVRDHLARQGATLPEPLTYDE